MPSEYRYIDGTLRAGYFCAICGQTSNMLALGHGIGRCEPNPTLVRRLMAANPPPGEKPHFTLTPNTFKYS